MVKKKGKSKRTTLKDKYKIQRRVVETNRKRKKQAKRDAKAGIVNHDKRKKDPGIPNSWPFKQDLLKDIQRARERQQEQQKEIKEKRKLELRALREHQDSGGSARTVQELMEQAQADRAAFEAKGGSVTGTDGEQQRSDGTVEAGQASRRAYLRELKKVIDTADVLLQVLDARDPIGSRIHPSVENTILSRADKRMVLVLNKIDLVPKEIVSDWLNYLRRSQPAIAIKSTKDSSTLVQESEDAPVPVGMEGLLQLLKNYARTGGTGGKSKTTIVVGVIGYPNVGKSSIINALKRSRAVGVSPRPGFTTSMQEVVLDRNVRLLDSPGVVFDDRSTLLGNCVDAGSIDDPIPAVEALIKRCNPASLVMTYNIPAFPSGDVMIFLSMVARSQGRILKGGIPNKVSAARAVIRDWNSGKIPYYTPPPKETKSVKHSDAVVVTKFHEEFDVSKYDEKVLSALDDKDEMDFVEIAPAEDESQGNEHQNEAVQYLTQGDDNDDAMEEDINDAAVAVNRKKLAEAEDFDFDTDL